MDGFNYKPLSVERAEIRLLVLQPGKNKDGINCNLIHASLHDSPNYEALSYTWGSPEHKRIIHLEGHAIDVTQNLYIALRALRSETEKRTLWVDAVCINQKDLAERSTEVQKMRDIYQRASRVVGWLGEASSDSDAAMCCIRDLATQANEDIKRQANDNFYMPLRHLFRRDYWSRVWVLQELVVPAVDPIIGCGDIWVPMSSISKVRRQMSPMQDYFTDEDDIDSGKCLDGHLLIREQYHTQGDLNIEGLIEATSRFKFTDPRDRLYALLGMALDQDRAAIIPDYSAPLQLVNWNLAAYLLHQCNDFRILSWNGLDYHSSAPSYAPDISSPLPQRDSKFFLQDYQVSTDQAHTKWDGATGSLTIRGRIIDRILTFKGPFQDIHELHPDDHHYHGESGRYRYPELLLITSLGIRLASEPYTPQEDDSTGFHNTAISQLIERVSAEHEYFLRKGYITDPAAYESLLQAQTGTYDTLVALMIMDEQFENPGAQRRRGNGHPFNVKMAFINRIYFVTEGGLLGVGPPAAQEGDVVVTFHGARLYYVLRQAKDGGYFFIGDAFLYNLMDGNLGKAARMMEKGTMKALVRWATLQKSRDFVMR